MKKYDRIQYIRDVPDIRLSNDLEVSIKYDGSNGRISCEDGEIIYGTRNMESMDTEFGGSLTNSYKRLNERILALSESNTETLKSILTEIVMYFELCGNLNTHKLRYNWDMKYILFDGWDKKEEKYISINDKRIQLLIPMLGLNTVEILGITNYDEAFEWIVEQDSMFIEGVVIKDYSTGERCKILHPKNSEIESVKFAKKKRTLNYNESKFMHKYITINRIEKIYNKIKAVEGDIGVRATGKVLSNLYKDIIEECLIEFIMTEKPDGLMFKYIRKSMPQIARPLFWSLIQK